MYIDALCLSQLQHQNAKFKLFDTIYYSILIVVNETTHVFLVLVPESTKLTLFLGKKAMNSK